MMRGRLPLINLESAFTMNYHVEQSPIQNFALKFRKFAMVLGAISAVSILIMIFSTSLDTIMRFVFNSPVPGMFELNEVLLVICVYMGITWTQMDRGHIRVEVFVWRLPQKARHYLNIVAWSITLLFIGILCVQTFYGFLDSFRIREFRWGSVQMPIWWAKGLIPVGCFLMMIQLTIDIIMEFQSAHKK